MTLQELSQLYHLNREVEMDQRRLEELERQNDDSIAAEIADLRSIIEAKQRRCIHERSRLERYIAAIPDSLTRQIFTYRFINGLPWSQVAASIGGNNTAGSVRMLCYRQLQRD